jgi:hypothetical protein
MGKAITKEVRALLETASEIFDETGCVQRPSPLGMTRTSTSDCAVVN